MRYEFFLKYDVSVAVICALVCLTEDSCKVCRYILVGLVLMLSWPCWWQCCGLVIIKCAYAVHFFYLAFIIRLPCVLALHRVQYISFQPMSSLSLWPLYVSECPTEPSFCRAQLRAPFGAYLMNNSFSLFPKCHAVKSPWTTCYIIFNIFDVLKKRKCEIILHCMPFIGCLLFWL